MGGSTMYCPVKTLPSQACYDWIATLNNVITINNINTNKFDMSKIPPISTNYINAKADSAA